MLLQTGHVTGGAGVVRVVVVVVTIVVVVAVVVEEGEGAEERLGVMVMGLWLDGLVVVGGGAPFVVFGFLFCLLHSFTTFSKSSNVPMSMRVSSSSTESVRTVLSSATCLMLSLMSCNIKKIIKR